MAEETTSSAVRATGSTLAAFIVALLGTVGSLYLSVGMGLKACPLCLYQRTFLLAVVLTFATGFLTKACCSPLLSLLALPAAIGGVGVAGFHVFLEWTGKLECPPGILGWGTAPQQSLTVFVVLLVALVTSVSQGRRTGECSGLSIGAAILLGLVAALATVKSAPPLPSAPTKPYEQPADQCRPPYRSPTDVS